MKKGLLTFFGLFIVVIAIIAFYKPDEAMNDESNKQSPFVGMWDWKENYPGEQDFAIWIGERNDSLLFGIGGVFYGGLKIHMPEYDDEGNMIAIVKTKIPKGNIVKSKIAETLSNFYFAPERMGVYNDVSFELLNDTTMLFILPDNKGYWPDTAIMHRRDRINRKFSNEEEELLYRE